MIVQRWATQCDYCGSWLRNGQGCVVSFEQPGKMRSWMQEKGWTWRKGYVWCGCEIKVERN